MRSRVGVGSTGAKLLAVYGCTMTAYLLYSREDAQEAVCAEQYQLYAFWQNSTSFLIRTIPVPLSESYQFPFQSTVTIIQVCNRLWGTEQTPDWNHVLCFHAGSIDSVFIAPICRANHVVTRAWSIRYAAQCLARSQSSRRRWPQNPRQSLLIIGDFVTSQRFAWRVQLKFGDRAGYLSEAVQS